MQIELPENEKWVSNAVGQYSVSRDGFVISHKRKDRRVMKNSVINPGAKQYTVVMLRISSCPKLHYVSHLVGEAFLDAPPDSLTKVYLRHRDGDNSNCCADNLYWQSCSDMAKELWAKGILVGKPTDKPTDEELSYVLHGEGDVSFTEHRMRYVLSQLCAADLVSAGIPEDYLKFSVKDHSIFKAWETHKALFSAIDRGLTLSKCAKESGVDFTMVSHVKAGRRLAKQRETYDKWVKSKAT